MTFQRDPGSELESAVATAVHEGLARDPRFAVGSPGPTDVVVKHMPSGLQYLVETRILPMGADDGDG